MNNIKIIVATTDIHIDYIARHYEETISLWENYQVTDVSIAKRKEQIRKWISDDDVHLTVAINHDGQPVGFNSLYIMTDYSGIKFGKIVILYVSPEYRNQGVARQLKIETETWLISKGISAVITEIDAKNERMLEINEKAGFSIKSYTFVKTLL